MGITLFCTPFRWHDRFERKIFIIFRNQNGVNPPSMTYIFFSFLPYNLLFLNIFVVSMLGTFLALVHFRNPLIVITCHPQFSTLHHAVLHDDSSVHILSWYTKVYRVKCLSCSKIKTESPMTYSLSFFTYKLFFFVLLCFQCSVPFGL